MKLVALCLAWSLVTAEATFRIKAGNSALPEGTVIEVSINGEGCRCSTGAATGKTDSRGYVTVIIKSDCQRVDAQKCKAVARAEVTAGGVKTVYRGSARLTQTTGGPYVSTVILVP
ncbi:MAG: hypothetical protein AB1631_01670 [Acidobacteriota bacterium]